MTDPAVDNAVDLYLDPRRVRLTAGQPMTKNLPESECFALLANHRRRTALRVLRDRWWGTLETNTRDHTEPLAVDQLAELIAAEIYENPSEGESYDIRLVLHHAHLPRLEECDVISYDRADRTIELRPNFDVLLPLLEKMTERDDSSTEASGPRHGTLRE
ncbi:hypothetical protein ACFQGT_07335 [Natrialbaceae archaeon GCM10025810]|uniref:DUF7344 domain-containing protein n=1 Tax=Halovalidus salilacus TaxID=3075124 RepID=UPI00361362B2